MEPMGVSSQDPQAAEFAALLPTCQRSVFLFAMSLLGNAADAEEVVQECGLLMWSKIPRIPAGNEFRRLGVPDRSIPGAQALRRPQSQTALVQQRISRCWPSQTTRSRWPDFESRRKAIAECIENCGPPTGISWRVATAKRASTRERGRGTPPQRAGDSPFPTADSRDFGEMRAARNSRGRTMNESLHSRPYGIDRPVLRRNDFTRTSPAVGKAACRIGRRPAVRAGQLPRPL